MSTQPAHDLCPWCSFPLHEPIGNTPEDRHVGECPHCGATHHVSCWQRNRGCATPGCVHHPRTHAYLPSHLQDIRPLLPTRAQALGQAHEDMAQRRQKALALLEQAVRSGDDRRIVETWQKHEALLQDIRPAPPHREAVRRATQRLRALAELEEAIQMDDDRQILFVWQRQQGELSHSAAAQRHLPRIQQAEKYLMAQHQLRDAMQNGSDAAIAQVWQQHRPLFVNRPPTDRERERIRLALERMAALVRLRASLAASDARQAIKTYAEHHALLEGCADFCDDDRQRTRAAFERAAVQATEHVAEALWSEDDETIANAYAEYVAWPVPPKPLTTEQTARVALANQRLEALRRLHRTLRDSNELDIARTYDQHERLLKPCRNLIGNDRRQVLRARRAATLKALRAAIGKGDAEKVVDRATEAIHLGCELSAAEHDSLKRARHTVTRLRLLQRALNADDDAAIAQAYDPALLDACPTLSDAQRQRIALAQERCQRWAALKHALDRDDDLDIGQRYDATLFSGSHLLEAAEIERCALALRRLHAYRALQDAFTTGDPYRIVRAYDEPLLGPSSLLSECERRQVAQARQMADALTALHAALDTNDPIAIREAYEAAQAAGARLDKSFPWERVLMAQQDAQTLLAFRHALEAADDAEIARLGSPLLATYPHLLSAEEQRRIRAATSRLGREQRQQRHTAAAHPSQPPAL